MVSPLLPLIPLAYLAGSIPFGLIVGLAKGVDPRKAGSGNIGATNVGRLLGGKYFALVFTLDLLKGAIPVFIAYLYFRQQTIAILTMRQPFETGLFEPGGLTLYNMTTEKYILWILVALAAVLGHMFPIFLKFKGGKGVATSAGVTLGLFPFYTIPCLGAAAVWGLVFWGTRYISVASIIGAIAFPVIYLFFALAAWWDPFGPQLPLLIFAFLVPIMIIYKHRSNIARLRAGTEHRFAKTSHE